MLHHDATTMHSATPIALAASTVPLIANTTAAAAGLDAWILPLVNLGATGCMLVWLTRYFAARQKRADEVEESRQRTEKEWRQELVSLVRDGQELKTQFICHMDDTRECLERSTKATERVTRAVERLEAKQ